MVGLTKGLLLNENPANFQTKLRKTIFSAFTALHLFAEILNFSLSILLIIVNIAKVLSHFYSSSLTFFIN